MNTLAMLDTILLVVTMAVLGLTTHANALRKAGAKPLLTALLLFVWPIAGGDVIDTVVYALMA